MTELMLPKGMRDRDPEDAILENEVIELLRTTFERYGYAPLETPLVERMDVLTAKFAAGEGTDVSKEIFKVQDQGDRELGLRFDMTVPLSRYVAMHPTIKLPFKRYAIGKVFRDGPIKLGRYREFWQADADIVGVPGPLADSEGVLMAAYVFSQLKLPVTISFSSRELLAELMESLSIEEALRGKAIIALDKLKKIGEEGVLKEMKAGGIPDKSAKELLSVVKLKGDNEAKMKALARTLPESKAIPSLQKILSHFAHLENVVFDPTLARGLSYYTGFFFECTLKESQISSSLVGTGRYDKMIGEYLDGAKEFPAVGVSFGVSVICDALREKNPEVKKSLTKIFVIPVSEHEIPAAQQTASKLRSSGINTDMDLLGRSIGKNFAYVDALGIPFAVVIGEEEVRAGTLTVKNMKTGEQKKVKIEDLISSLK